MDYCADCTYLDTNDYKGNCNGLYYCEKRCDYVVGNSPYCGDFCRAYSRSDYQIKDIIHRGEQEAGYSSSCYLTTIVTHLLGKNDKGYVLTTLRNFRKNILQKNEEYKRILVEYDIIGPKISEEILKAPNKVEVAENLYNNILIKVVAFLENGEYEEAIKLYKGMTYGLQVCYGLANMTVDPAIIEARSITDSGYGRQRVKTQ